MSNQYVDVDVSEFKAFFQKMERAAKGDFRKELELFLEAIGNEFLAEVQDALIHRHKNTGLGQLVSSFVKDDEHNIWSYEDGGLTLEVGSSLEYAIYVNSGHRTLDPAKNKHFTLKSGELARFVPGYWQGKRFIYDRSADGGMVLRLHWVDGLYFFDFALGKMEKTISAALDKKLQDWLDRYFGEF